MTEQPSKDIKTQKTKAVQYSRWSFKCKESVDSLPGDLPALSKGVAGTPSCETIPVLVPMEVDTLVPDRPKTNAQMVFTRDRPGSRFGVKGSGTGASAIDIVVGRQSFKATGQEQLVDPSFTDDAARIYISQKSDIDKDFKIIAGGVGLAAAKSAIALKADGIRIIAREGIKLVTGTDENNSQGGDIKSIYGIDILAGNQDGELEPMVKGKKLMATLDELGTRVEELNAAVVDLLTTQMEMNLAIQNHFHYSPWYGNPTMPSDACQAKGATTSMNHLQQTRRSLTSNRQNIVAWKQNNLCESGRNFPLSRWNKTN
jgi:hypothetical protein